MRFKMAVSTTVKTLLQRLRRIASPQNTFVFSVRSDRDFSWKRVKIIFIAFLVLVIIYSLFPFYGPASLGRTWRGLRDNSLNPARCNVLQQIRFGKWRKRTDLQPDDQSRRTNEDVRVRRLRGLPTVLYRDDLRCGNSFPLDSRLTFGYELPSLCDAKGSTPCCNHDKGWCGSGIENCLCKTCTDFRDIVPAELHEYVPSSSNCRFKNFTSKQACDFLSGHVSSLTLMGDSLVRHLNNAMFILLTDDKNTGCLTQDLPESDKNLCSGDMQFVDGGKSICHSKTAKRISDLQEGKFCHQKYSFEYSFHEYYSVRHAPFALSVVRQNLNKKNTIIVFGVGIHMKFSAETVIKDYVGPIVQLKEQYRSHWPLLVWLTAHAPGKLKPLAFLPTQNADQVLRFNQEMTDYLESRNVIVFDTFNLTLGVHSYDGTHYGFGINMMKAQLLLDYLEQTLQV